MPNAYHRTITVGVPVDVIESMETIKAAVLTALDQKRPWLMSFVNPATAVAARRMPTLSSVLDQFDMVAPDGSGMVVAIRKLHRADRAQRFSFDGTSLAPMIFELASERNLSIVLCGGATGVAEQARDKLLEAYVMLKGDHPKLRIIGVCDGYGFQDVTIEAITRLAPDIVIVGMGVLAQEQFLLALVKNGWNGIGFTCGGYLDQLALKGENYYPVWVDRRNLRFAYRLVMEPKRLWRRYLLEYPEFMFRLGVAILQNKGMGL